jgi:hypothetical protein
MSSDSTAHTQPRAAHARHLRSALFLPHLEGDVNARHSIAYVIVIEA